MCHMYVLKPLRLNRFQARPNVSSRRLFDLFGYSKPAVVSKQTSEDVDSVIPAAASKLQALALGQEIAAKRAEFEKDPEQTPPLGRIKPNEL